MRRPAHDAAEHGDEQWSREYRRPYAVTRGRTRPTDERTLEVEALVCATVRGEATSASLMGDRKAIVLLCRDVMSVAEIAAHIEEPLGVARILVSDLADQGFVVIYRPPDQSNRPDLALLERVLYGLHAL